MILIPVFSLRFKRIDRQFVFSIRFPLGMYGDPILIKVALFRVRLVLRSKVTTPADYRMLLV